MAHPEEQAHAVLALGFEHGAIRVVVDELREGDPVGGVGRTAKVFVDHRPECCSALCARESEVMQAPVEGLRPHCGLGHHGADAVEGRDVWRAEFAVEFGVGGAEVEGCVHRAIGAVAADGAVGGAADVGEVGVQFGKQRADALVERGGWEPLVAAAVEADAGVAADALDEVARVAEKHRIVFRHGAVPGVRKPEVLPDDDAVAVAGLVEGIIADLADPVAHHDEVHVVG